MKTKYCGIQSKEDLEVVAHSLCDYIGYVFAKSKRQVLLDDVMHWNQSVPHEKKNVALVVNATIEQIKPLFEANIFHVLQLHGSESVESVKAVRHAYPTIELWKAIHVDDSTVEQLHRYAPYVDGLLLDTKSTQAWGGTGQTFDWERIPTFIQVANRYETPLFIAGGIKKENIQDAQQYNVFGLDLSSGIERNGRKNIRAIEELEEVIER
ncbi:MULTISPECIES: phosphoribosylanthranilate isomerase [Shouchella]|uniref:N-(5'-phosphoribosyl)anthranilate isomerase n=2 Tax=Shouchella TaxID=2893057 RepID=A0ABY7W7E4_9BACI|nr:MULTISPECIES: phosphoribosylanthranilate isomerase [Shouchella]MED4127066.1 phosphoribosylanthranilate isomerase [Shouchella miscanthi]WDF03554.1 phosphoribosylanthranilate isomerase [Shouchella hunanensis]